MKMKPPDPRICLSGIAQIGGFFALSCASRLRASLIFFKKSSICRQMLDMESIYHYNIMCIISKIRMGKSLFDPLL